MPKGSRTIIDAIKEVLSQSASGMTKKEIYNEIIARKLYSFKAKDPEHVVNSTIRKHCVDLDFATASPRKHFKIAGVNSKGKNYYILKEVEAPPKKQSTKETNDFLPEEKIQMAYVEHRENVKTQLLNCILENDPLSFVRLVLQLLHKLGYGYSMESITITDGPNDGGIDGIIDEDRLGLDKIYVQAKRYSANHKVGV